MTIYNFSGSNAAAKGEPGTLPEATPAPRLSASPTPRPPTPPFAIVDTDPPLKLKRTDASRSLHTLDFNQPPDFDLLAGPDSDEDSNKPVLTAFQEFCQEQDLKKDLSKSDSEDFERDFEMLFGEKFKLEHVGPIMKLSPLKLLQGALRLAVIHRGHQEDRGAIKSLTEKNKRLSAKAKYYRAECLRLKKESEQLNARLSALQKEILALKAHIRKDQALLERLLGPKDKHLKPTPTVQRALQSRATLFAGSPIHERHRQQAVAHHATLGSLPQYLHPKPEVPRPLPLSLPRPRVSPFVSDASAGPLLGQGSDAAMGSTAGSSLLTASVSHVSLSSPSAGAKKSVYVHSSGIVVMSEDQPS